MLAQAIQNKQQQSKPLPVYLFFIPFVLERLVTYYFLRYSQCRVASAEKRLRRMSDLHNPSSLVRRHSPTAAHLQATRNLCILTQDC